MRQKNLGRNLLLSAIGTIFLLSALSVFAQPANDNFENRIRISGFSTNITASNVGATRQDGEPTTVGGVRAGASVWWEWTAPASGTTIIDTIGSSFDTVLGVYTGTAINALTPIAQNNNIGGGTNQSRVSFEAVAGTRYIILVGGTRIFGGIYNTGTIQLHLAMAYSVTLTSPVNNSFYALGAPITVSATASSPAGSIQQIEFYRSGLLIDTITTPPYSIVITNAPLGQNTFYAVMVDSANNRVTSSVATVTVVLPGIVITVPSDGTYFTNTNSITISATAVLSSGSITNLSFYVNGYFIGSGIAQVSSQNFSTVWTNVVPGVHRINAIGYTDTGVSYTSAFVYVSVPYTLIPSNSVWKYNDKGIDLGTEWIALNYDDSGWAEGEAELGYGDEADGRPEKTQISYGPDPNNKYITYYFRRTFVIPNPQSYTNLFLRVMRDDGAVVYINGVEAGRFNMPSGTITYTTLAPNAGDDGTVFYGVTVPANLLVAGTNIIAVEVHQTGPTSSDISFDLELLGMPVIIRNQPPIITLLTPTNNSVFFAPSSIPIRVNASDPDGVVEKVEFFINGKSVSTIVDPPYTYNWDNPAIGEYTISVVATDDQKAISEVRSSVVVYDAIGTPLVQITYPPNNAVFGNLTNYTNLTISASVTSPTLIRQVEFTANDTLLLGIDTTSPYSIVWTNASFGTNKLIAIAETDTGLRATSAPVTVVLIKPPINTNPPVIASVMPAPGSSVVVLTNIQVIFSENVIGVNASDLLVNGQPALTVSGSGSNYIFTITQPPTGDVLVSWAVNHGITDIGYPINLPFDATAPGATWTYKVVDITPPTIVSQIPPAGATVTNLSQITIVFSEPVINVDASDLLINGSPAISKSGTGTTYIWFCPATARHS